MRLVVVGGVAAGMSAASAARRADGSLEIIVLEKGQRVSYGACGLPYLFEGQVDSIDQLTVYTPDFFRKERNIDVRLNAEVAAIQHPKREVVLRSGERLHYDKLVWAAGARAVRWKVDDPRLFALHTDVDAVRLQQYLEQRQPRRAAVVGGGYIGLEMTEALRARGLDVTLYHSGSQLLHTNDSWLTGRILERLQRSRVDVRLNTKIDDPRSLDADLIVGGIGLKPNVEVLAEAGAEVGRTGALRVTDLMETGLHGVYAAGDCCETTHLVSHTPTWIPLGTTANKMGQVAGQNAAGGRERFPGVVGTAIVRVCGLGVGTSGLSEHDARQAGFQPVSVTIQSKDKPGYFGGREIEIKLIADARTHRLLGGMVLGDQEILARVNVIATALTARMKVEDLVYLDLAYAPPFATALDPVLDAARRLLKLLD